MILLFLTTVLLVPQWQVLPTAATPTAIVVADNNVVADDDDKIDISPMPLVDELSDEQKKIDDRREILENTLKASQEEVAAVAEAYSIGRTTIDQLDDAKRRNLEVRHALLLDLYRTQVVVEKQDFGISKEYHKLGQITEAELVEAERKLLNTEITLWKFILDNEVHFAHDPDTITQARENLPTCYQRLLELARLDFERSERRAANGIATQEELRTYRQKMLEAEILVARFQLQEAQRKNAISSPPLANAASSDSRVTIPVRKTSKFTPAEQERLKALYMQIVEQEKNNLKIVQMYYEANNPRGTVANLLAAQGAVTQAKITLSAFLLNETDLTLDEYARERQHLRSLYVELRDLAKKEVEAAKAVFERDGITYPEVSRTERKLTEIEITLIRLFPEKDGVK